MNKPWRVGRKVGRTIYDSSNQLIGVMDTVELAKHVVSAANDEGWAPRPGRNRMRYETLERELRDANQFGLRWMTEAADLRARVVELELEMAERAKKEATK